MLYDWGGNREFKEEIGMEEIKSIKNIQYVFGFFIIDWCDRKAIVAMNQTIMSMAKDVDEMTALSQEIIKINTNWEKVLKSKPK